MNNLDPLVSTGPSRSHSPRLNRRDTINVRTSLKAGRPQLVPDFLPANTYGHFTNDQLNLKVLSLGEDVLPNYIMDKKIGQEDRWIILHYSPFKVNRRSSYRIRSRLLDRRSLQELLEIFLKIWSCLQVRKRIKNDLFVGFSTGNTSHKDIYYTKNLYFRLCGIG